METEDDGVTSECPLSLAIANMLDMDTMQDEEQDQQEQNEAKQDETEHKTKDLNLDFLRNGIKNVRESFIQKSLILRHIPISVLTKQVDENDIRIRTKALEFLIKLSVCDFFVLLKQKCL